MSYIDSSPSELEIEHAFEMLLVKLQNLVDDYFAQNYKNLSPPRIEFKKGGKYWKVIATTVTRCNRPTGRSVYAFIRRSDGAILRPATWSSPELRTKHPVRGYITDDDCMQWFNSSGVVYASY